MELTAEFARLKGVNFMGLTINRSRELRKKTEKIA